MVRYINKFRDTIVQLYKLGKIVGELHLEYGITKYIISTWLKDNSPVYRRIR